MADTGEPAGIASAMTGNLPVLRMAEANPLGTDVLPSGTAGAYDWNEMEDRILIRLRETYGPAWDKIAKFFPGLSEEVIQDRWNNTGPRRKKVAWTPEDDTLLVRARAAIGANWKEIGELFPGRNAESCRKHFASIKAGASSENTDGVFPREKRKRKGKGSQVYAPVEGLLQPEDVNGAAAPSFFVDMPETAPLQKQVEMVPQSDLVQDDDHASWHQQEHALHVQTAFVPEGDASWQPHPLPVPFEDHEHRDGLEDRT